MSAPHAPVMLDEVLHWLEPRDGGLYVDGTFGAGGYTRAVLGVEGTRVLAVDRDPTAREAADAVMHAYPQRFALAQGPFSLMADVIERAGSSGVDGVMLDLGVSSMQIDRPERGFSFAKDGPLDMRMSIEGPSAADAVNHLEPDELAAIFRVYGEEKRARRAAQFICEARAEAPIETTGRLAEIVSRAVGLSKTSRIHPATRVFQALRIFVNDELGELARGLIAAEQVLRPAGRLVVVSFHSLEDRMVKTFMRERAGLVSRGSRHLPEPEPGPEPSFALLTRKAVEASEGETAANPRARSAKLRAASRTPAPAHDALFTPPGGVPPYERLVEIQR
jgi:16S rRNA (cytosine1402-N4)-methyltransferase